MQRLTSLLLCTALCAFVLNTTGCAPDRLPTNIILISIDTLRADAVGRPEGQSRISPKIDAFFSESVAFRRAYAPQPHTLPSHVSLLTALHPLSHGVAAELSGGLSLATGIPTLASLLRDAGYTTAAFVNGGFLHPRFGVAQGFDHYDYVSDIERGGNYGSGSGQAFGRTAAETNNTIFAWLDSRQETQRQEPVFLFLHYFDVHSDTDSFPYDAPPDYLVDLRPDAEALLGRSAQKLRGSEYLMRVSSGEIELSAEGLAIIRGLYDAGLQYMDDQFGELLSGLDARGLYRDSLIILVSDHGEEFMEHGRMLHSQVFEESVRVPMAFRFPDRLRVDSAGQSVRQGWNRQPVGLLDVMPTVLDFLGLPLPKGVQGRSLMPIVDTVAKGDKTRDWQAQPVYLSEGRAKQLGMATERWKLIYHPVLLTAKLYDLERDPMETLDVSKQFPEVTERGIAAIKQWQVDLPTPYRKADPDVVVLDDQTLQQLCALGYCAGSP